MPTMMTRSETVVAPTLLIPLPFDLGNKTWKRACREEIEEERVSSCWNVCQSIPDTRSIGAASVVRTFVQEMFIRVYRHLHRFDRSKKFSTWI